MMIMDEAQNLEDALQYARKENGGVTLDLVARLIIKVLGDHEAKYIAERIQAIAE